MNTQPGVIGEKIGFTQYFTPDGTVKRVKLFQGGEMEGERIE